MAAIRRVESRSPKPRTLTERKRPDLRLQDLVKRAPRASPSTALRRLPIRGSSRLSGRGAGLTSKSLRSARALPRAQGLRQHVQFDAFSSVPGPTLQLARENARGIAGGREMRALKAGSASIRSAKGIRTADRAALCPEPWSRRAVVAGEGLEAAVGRDRGACAAVSSCACGDPRLLADPGS